MADQPIGLTSPLEEISYGIFKGKTFAKEKTVSVDAARVVLLENDPNRLAWSAINESAVDVRVSNDPTLTGSTGWLLNASGGVVSMVYYDDGEVTGYQVFAFGAAAGASVRVREVLRS